jgi:hypothetical protein
MIPLDQEWIIKFNLQDAEFCNKIKDTIAQVISDVGLVSSTEYRSSKGKNIKQYDFYEFSDIFFSYSEFVENVLRQNKIIKETDLLKPVSCWTVTGEENSYHTFHQHNNKEKNHLATVLYLSLPDNNKDQLGSFYAMINNSVKNIDPTAGDILVFPVHVYHGTYPQGPGIRQTLNIDYEIVSR